jgi:hypothetical protein
MAGDWIKMRTDLATDPAVFRISTITKLDRFAVVGRLHTFWVWVEQNTVDGRVDAVSTQVVDEIVGQTGFADAMEVVGWIKIEHDTITVPHFDRHMGEGWKQRIAKNSRQKRWRDGKKDVDVSETPERLRGRRERDACRRLEKRREEINTPLPPTGVVEEMIKALSEQTGEDPTLAKVGRKYSDAAGELLAANPPYAPEDARRAGRDWKTVCKYSGAVARDRPALGDLTKAMGLLRSAPKPTGRTKKMPSIDVVRKCLADGTPVDQEAVAHYGLNGVAS